MPTECRRDRTPLPPGAGLVDLTLTLRRPAASLVLAELVTRSADRRLMTASAGLAAAVIVGFVINRTVGLPNAMDDVGNWSEPLGMISLLIEGVVL
jgi:hypothetical protein